MTSIPVPEGWNNLLTVKEVADRLKVSRKTVFQYIKNEKLNRIKIEGLTRIRESDLNDFINGIENKSTEE